MATSLATANLENQSLRSQLTQETKKATAILQEAVLTNEDRMKMKEKMATLEDWEARMDVVEGTLKKYKDLSQ